MVTKEIAEEIDPKEINLDDPSQLLKDLMKILILIMTVQELV